MEIKFGPFINNSCKNGHPRTKQNVGWLTYKKGNKKYRSPTCKQCRAIAAKAKYWENAEYRERKKAESKAYYHHNVKAKNAVQNPR